MFSSLRTQLSLSLLLALIAILSTQLLIRQFVILPRFHAQEYTINKLDLEQLKAATDQNFDTFGNVVYDNAVWEEMVDRMAAGDADFLDDTYNDPDFFQVLDIDGTYFYQADRTLLWGLALDGDSQEVPVPALTQPAPTLASALLVSREEWTNAGHTPVIKKGFTRLDGQPVMFVSVSVTQPNQTERFEGTVLFWRLLDDGWLASISQAVRSQLTLNWTEAQPPHAVEAAEVFEPNVPIERGQEVLTLLYRDISGAPFLSLGLNAHERAYKDQLLDESLLAEIVVAIVALAAFYFFLNYSTIQPIHRLSRVVNWVRKTGNYGQRSEITLNNEVGRLAVQLDKMLELIGSQRQELLSHNRRLQELSDTDQLTGLSNRRYLESLIYDMEDTPTSSLMAVSLLVIDIDHFKHYNDFYGHAAGDRTIQTVARLLKGLTHSATDNLARYGGEEFVLVLQHTEADSALAVAERLKNAIYNLGIPHASSPTDSVLTLSIGVATKPAGQVFHYSTLFNAADHALYQAKHQGRNCIRSRVLQPESHV